MTAIKIRLAMIYPNGGTSALKQSQETTRPRKLLPTPLLHTRTRWLLMQQWLRTSSSNQKPQKELIISTKG
jgi:hypothetical protein